MAELTAGEKSIGVIYTSRVSAINHPLPKRGPERSRFRLPTCHNNLRAWAGIQQRERERESECADLHVVIILHSVYCVYVCARHFEFHSLETRVIPLLAAAAISFCSRSPKMQRPPQRASLLTPAIMLGLHCRAVYYVLYNTYIYISRLISISRHLALFPSTQQLGAHSILARKKKQRSRSRGERKGPTKLSGFRAGKALSVSFFFFLSFSLFRPSGI